MDKPKIGDKVRLKGDAAENFEVGIVFEVHESIEPWWDTAHGENKLGLMDMLEEYQGPPADWYLQLEDVDGNGTMAVASFEVEAIIKEEAR